MSGHTVMSCHVFMHGRLRESRTAIGGMLQLTSSHMFRDILATTSTYVERNVDIYVYSESDISMCELLISVREWLA